MIISTIESWAVVTKEEDGWTVTRLDDDAHADGFATESEAAAWSAEHGAAIIPHQLGEICLPGCPSKSAEIAALVRHHWAAYGAIKVTAADVDRALALADEPAAGTVDYRIRRAAECWH